VIPELDQQALDAEIAALRARQSEIAEQIRRERVLLQQTRFRRDVVCINQHQRELDRLLAERDWIRWEIAQTSLAGERVRPGHTVGERALSALDSEAARCQRVPTMVVPGICPRCGSRAARDHYGVTCLTCGWAVDDERPRRSLAWRR
jgi:hypothetical protein